MNRFSKTLLMAAMMAAGVASAAVPTPVPPVNSTTDNFTMLDGGGGMVGSNSVGFTWDGTTLTPGNFIASASNAGISNAFQFFGYVWTAHDVKVLGAGSYTTPEGYAFTVAAGQLGMYMLFDWGITADIGVVEICEQGTFTTTGAAVWDCASTDGDGDGIRGIAMNNGPFVGFNANFNLNFAPYYGSVSVPVAYQIQNQAEVLEAGLPSVVNKPATTVLTFDRNYATFEISYADGVTTFNPGDVVTVTIPLTNVPNGATLYLVDGNGFHLTTATFDANAKTVTYDITKGGNGDTCPADMTKICDPVGVGVPPVAAAVLGNAGSAGGGCVTDPAGRDVGLLVTLLAGLGYTGWRRRRS